MNLEALLCRYQVRQSASDAAALKLRIMANWKRLQRMTVERAQLIEDLRAFHEQPEATRAAGEKR